MISNRLPHPAPKADFLGLLSPISFLPSRLSLQFLMLGAQYQGIPKGIQEAPQHLPFTKALRPGMRVLPGTCETGGKREL